MGKVRAMNPLRPVYLGCLAALLLLLACQKNDQATVQPEKLAEQSSATAAPSAAKAAAEQPVAAGDDSAATAGAPGPLVPYASGKGPSDATPPPAEPKKGSPATDQPSTGKVASGSPAGAPEVKLVKPGAEPRRELRITVKPGQKEVMKMTMTMAIGMKMGARSQPTNQLPPMIMDMDMKVTDVKPNGDLRYEFTLSKTDVGKVAGIDPKIRGAIKQALGGLKGLGGWAEVTNRGLT